jgi:hypothetical protein
MQTNNTLMLKDDRFAELEKNELKKAKLTFKNREMLIIIISIKFNDEMISIIEVASKNSYSFISHSTQAVRSNSIDQHFDLD